MSETGPDGSVECPICGESFDPAAAGGWCTNTQCGEWQHTDDTSERDASADDTDQSSPASGQSASSSEQITCPDCDTELDADANFCLECGADLSAATPEEPTAPDALILVVADTEIPVTEGEPVGREIRTALTDAGYAEDDAVRIHREHIRIVRENGTFYLHDLGENPTALNGEPVRDRTPIEPGDEIELSGVATLSVQES